MYKFEKIDKSEAQSVFSEIYDLTSSTENILIFKLEGMAGLWHATFYRATVDEQEVARERNQSAVKAMRAAIKKAKDYCRDSPMHDV